MPRHDTTHYELTDAEKRDLIKLIGQGKPHRLAACCCVAKGPRVSHELDAALISSLEAVPLDRRSLGRNAR